MTTPTSDNDPTEINFWDIYEPSVRLKAKSVFGNREEDIPIASEADLAGHPEVVQAFIRDCELQELRICSANIGFIYTYTKQYKKRDQA